MQRRSRHGKKKTDTPTGKSERSSEQRGPTQAWAGTTGRNPAAEKLAAKIRMVLQEGIRAAGPQRQSLTKRATALGELLNGWQLYDAGNIAEFSKQSEELQKKHPFLKLIPPPPWADQEVACKILDWLRKANKQHPGAAEKFISWLQKMLSAPRGRPVDPTLVPVAQEAARLKAKGLTWGQVASKVCPQRHAKNHQCTKNRCADRIRLLVKQSGLTV